MLVIEGGRSCLYQWDVDQRLEVLNSDVLEVHFSNTVISPALVCEVYEEDGRRFANIPNELLQQAWSIHAHGCCEYRVRDVLICRVVRRAKPADYVYTETEVKRYEDLDERIKALEEAEDEDGGGAVESVNGKTGKVVLTAGDVGAIPKDNPGTIKSTGVLIAGEGSVHTARMEGGEGRAMFSMRDKDGNILNRVSLRETETTLGQPLAVGSGGHGGKNAAEGRANLGAVSKDGDTMTGKLTVPEMVVEATGGKNPGLQFASTVLGKVFSQIKASATTLKMYIQNFSPNGAGSEIYNLPVPDSGLTSDKHYDLLTSKNAVSIPQGGTNAKTAEGARNNLDVYSKGETDDKLSQLSEEIAELKESGGAGVAVDATLTQEGKAADAKVVGDELNVIKTTAFDLVTGKNLFNGDTSVVGAIQANGSVATNGVYANYRTSDYIAVVENTDYTISVWDTGNLFFTTGRKMYTFFDAHKTPIANSHASIPGEKEVTFNSADAAYVRVAAYIRYDNAETEFGRIQIEKGATGTPYEPYTEKEMVLKNGVITNDVLRGKKWAVFGDSFTADGGTGTKLTTGTYSGQNYVYPYIIGNRTGMDVLPFCNGGRTLAYPAEAGEFTNSATCPTDSRYYQNVPEDVDYITFQLGINDSHHASGDSGTDGEETEGIIPIGTIDDADTSTYYGAWNVVLTWLIENRPFAHIGILVSNGCDSDDYRTAQIAIAKKYGIPYIDLNGDERTPVMIRSTNPDISSAVKTLVNIKQAVDYDGTVSGSVNRHPNDAAHEYESRFIENFLRTI